ncbi:RxLR effector protein [Phytophthora megakarya]|uniref:RxLR effector protein n=1 Tax=Phytophthora megakarya TaxID=4795 RepID=A0A225W2E6_9STRA|nr:RxLR effector protein [Phytophthora megakarya]
MRLRFLLVVFAMVGTDFVFATTKSAHTQHSSATRTASTHTVRVLDGTLNESNGKRFLRTSKDMDEYDSEERTVPVITYYADEITASGVRKFLRDRQVISTATSKWLENAGFSKEELANMYARYIAIAKRPSS